MQSISINISWDAPWLALAAATAVMPLLTAIWLRRRGRHVGAAGTALQSLALLLAALALAQPRAVVGTGGALDWLILQDVSASLRGQEPPSIHWPPGVTTQTVRFADGVLAPSQSPANRQTNLAPALAYAMQQESLAGVAVISDGQFHDDWQAAAAALGHRGVQVLAIPMAYPPGDAQVASLQAQRRPDGRADLTVQLAATAAQKRTLIVQRLAPQEATLLERPMDLLAGESITLHVVDPTQPTDRVARYRARLTPADAFAENDDAAAAMLPSRAKFAAVGLAPGAADAVAPKLAGTLETIDPGGAPADAAGWDDYAAVVLADATGELLDANQRSALAAYVRQGGGLVLVGAGPQDPPGGPRDALNRVAPLSPNLYQRQPLDLRIVLDASGSMSERAQDSPGQTKFELAAAAVLAMRNHLSDRDRLTVITFNDTPRLTYASDGRIDAVALQDALRRVQPSGPTNVAAALEEASARPADDGKTGLVIVVSDLLASPFDPAAMAGRLGAAKLALAVVAIESPADAPQAAPLESLASALKAPLVRRDSLGGLAEIFAAFVRRSRGELIRRGEFTAAMAKPIEGVGPAALPPLRAYVPCSPAKDAQVLAVTEGDPIIASATAGLGRAVSWALPLTTADNAAWMQSADVTNLLAGAVAWAARPADAAWSGEIVWQSGKEVVAVWPTAPAQADSLELTARVAAGEADEPAVLAMARTAPHRYEAVLPQLPTPASVVVCDADGRRLWQGEAGSAAAPEFRAIGPNYDSLRRLAELTGGRVVAPDDAAAAVRDYQRQSATVLWHWLLLAAAAMMLLEWSLTRIRRRSSPA